jgi:Zn-dependent protease with chaperone function
MKEKVWIVQRAALALALMVSFYALALGLAAFLVWIPYEAWTHDVRLPAKIAAICVGLAVVIVWAVLPRPDKFVPPGPTVTASKEPALFTVLSEVAAATNQDMPADVYLVNDANAFVAQRGGVMGFGSRRVMGLGLPLMQAVTVQEFKGIVAHEFGHYHGGDVKIGPWIYKTHAAIARAIEQLSDSIVQTVFIWYGNLFIRVTHAVSRRQEFIADAVAARVAGAGSMASALRNAHRAGIGFPNYWKTEVGPVLNAGFLPPITAGFARFLETGSVSARLQQAVRTEEAEGQTDPFDTHPPLRERIAALAALPRGVGGDVRPAIALLSNAGAWERELLRMGIDEEWARSLRPLDWDSVVAAVYVPMWRAAVAENAANLSVVTPATVPFANRLSGAVNGGTFGDAEQALLREVRVTAFALSLTLYELGWTAKTSPGEEIAFERNGETVRPSSELFSLAAGKISTADWNSRCLALGIAAVPLGTRAAA